MTPLDVNTETFVGTVVAPDDPDFAVIDANADLRAEIGVECTDLASDLRGGRVLLWRIARRAGGDVVAFAGASFGWGTPWSFLHNPDSQISDDEHLPLLIPILKHAFDHAPMTDILLFFVTCEDMDEYEDMLLELGFEQIESGVVLEQNPGEAAFKVLRTTIDAYLEALE